MEKNSFFNKKSWKNWTSTYKQIHFDTGLMPFTKIKMDHKCKMKDIKLPEDNIRENLDGFAHDNNFKIHQERHKFKELRS